MWKMNVQNAMHGIYSLTVAPTICILIQKHEVLPNNISDFNFLLKISCIYFTKMID
jgi:hypothetical protein